MLARAMNSNPNLCIANAARANAADRRAPRSKPTQSIVAQADAPPLRLVRRAHVVILGNKRTTEPVRRALESEDIAAFAYVSADSAMQALTNTTSAVIVVPPLSGEALAPVCLRFTKHEYNVPVLVACGPDSEKSQKKLYDLGVAAVFVWPVDRAALLRTVFRISRRTRPSRKKKSSQEIALEELVSSHLRTEASVIGRKLRVRVTKRFVMLCGHVDSLWQVKAAENIAADVAGVDDVFSDAVLVSGDPDLSDRGIANAVRQVLKHTAGADASTLAVSVDAGVVTLAGSVANRSELDRVVNLISHTRGVVKIEDWAVVTAKGNRKDHQVVKSVRDAVALRFPKGKIDVAVFGGIAVVSGKVQSSAERRDLELLVSRQAGVQRVVDKLRVAGAGRAN